MHVQNVELLKQKFNYEKDYLDKIDVCRHLLPEPGDIVVGELVSEIRILRKLVEAVQEYSWHVEGICCKDVDGKNWFDARAEALG